MRLHEVMGIEQNRAWGVCSLNDFRRVSQPTSPIWMKPYTDSPSVLSVPRIETSVYHKSVVRNGKLTFRFLTAYASFLEWNSNPEVADAAEKLYGNIEYLELYTGLQAEEAKPLVEGAGLCPGEHIQVDFVMVREVDVRLRLYDQSCHSFGRYCSYSRRPSLHTRLYTRELDRLGLC